MGRPGAFVFSGGFVWQRRVRRIMALAGHAPRLGLPAAGDTVAVWGAATVSQRGRRIAARRGARLLTVEDAFLRSLHPGRARGGPPLGLILDPEGLHFDPAAPSRIERLLSENPLDDTALLDRAREGIWRMRASHLSKYSATDPALPVPAPGYVLVIDQVEGDASVRLSGGTRARFAEMLTEARLAHPGARVVVKTHPESARGLRRGHFDTLPDGVEAFSAPASPWDLLEGAIAVYTLSSQMGFEAILAGHRPVVFGQPFYAGWGLTDDRAAPLPRRRRRLTRAQLFAGAMILAPTWYDPLRDRLGSFEDALGAMEAATRAWREDRHGWTAAGMRLWKRPVIARAFGTHGRVRFGAPRAATPHMVWGTARAQTGSTRVEDGFLRSAGLGAALTPPVSLILDDLGIYYDPATPSRMEHLITEAATLPAPALRRAARLIDRITRLGLSKYNLAGTPSPSLPAGRTLLVVGQVEDDASVTLGGGSGNRALLQAARAANPDAVLLWKPHPDVEAGLRPGKVADVSSVADAVLRDLPAPQALALADEVWTMTSLMGFEALLRGIPVTCLGAPFYAGWGLTRDLGPVPARRQARPSLVALAHAALIAAPRYFDPATGQPWTVERALDQLASGTPRAKGPGLRLLAKGQGLLAGRAPFWR